MAARARCIPAGQPDAEHERRPVGGGETCTEASAVQARIPRAISRHLAVSPNGTEAYWYANSSGIEGARNGALGRCREKAGRECTIVMENDDLVRPMVTSAAGSNV